MLLSYETAAAVLIGSIWASHTLVAYPDLRKLGVVDNPAVATALGATVITDTIALVVLAVIVGTAAGEESGATLVKGAVREAAPAGRMAWARGSRSDGDFILIPGRTGEASFMSEARSMADLGNVSAAVVSAPAGAGRTEEYVPGQVVVVGGGRASFRECRAGERQRVKVRRGRASR